MSAREDMTGQRFGRLVVKSYEGHDRHYNRSMWRCVCDCGNEHVVWRTNLRFGKVKSCGCLRREVNAKNGKRKRIAA